MSYNNDDSYTDIACSPLLRKREKKGKTITSSKHGRSCINLFHEFFSHLSNLLETTHTIVFWNSKLNEKKKEKDGGIYLNKDVAMMMEETTMIALLFGGNGTTMWVATCDGIAT